jgi:hypothetical protein
MDHLYAYYTAFVIKDYFILVFKHSYITHNPSKCEAPQGQDIVHHGTILFVI